MKNETRPEEPIGKVLKKRRQALKLSLTDVELATKIRGKFLVALESGDYRSLSHNVYSKGFVATYAEFLGLNPRAVTSQYLAERGELPDERPKGVQPATKTFVITPKLIMVGLASLVAISVASYLGWQVSTLAAAPSLTLSTPASDQVIEGSLADVNGHATLGADVYINDSPVLTDVNGNFHEKVALQDGVNAIRIMAKNKLGKTTVVTRNILAKKPTAQVADQATTIDGVRVDVAIKKSAVSITVVVDGQNAFDGTMLAGTVQTFSGNRSVVITTGNAGETALKVTNANVAVKSIDPAGQEGEVKRNLEFDKDTVIP